MLKTIKYLVLALFLLIVLCSPDITGPGFEICSSEGSSRALCMKKDFTEVKRFRGGGDILISWEGERYKCEFFTLLDSSGKYLCEVMPRIGGGTVLRIEAFNDSAVIDFMGKYFKKGIRDTIREIPVVGNSGIIISDIMDIFCGRIYGKGGLRTPADSSVGKNSYMWKREGIKLKGDMDTDDGTSLERLRVIGEGWSIEYSEFRMTLPLKIEFRSSDNNYIIVEYSKDFEFTR